MTWKCFDLFLEKKYVLLQFPREGANFEENLIRPAAFQA